MADYEEKWSNPYGPGEMALTDTRSFARGAFTVSAVPFRTGAVSIPINERLFGQGASSRPAPAVRSTPCERVMTTGVRSRRRTASTTWLPRAPVPPVTAIVVMGTR